MKLGTSGTDRMHNITQHLIDTSDSPPVKVPPRPISSHFVDEVQQLLADMAQEGLSDPVAVPGVPQQCICLGKYAFALTLSN